ncbi:MAG: hypothetical protein KIT31_35550 [Deltaproteobacteria bacterium]|nr:hypothetical protein [Deltaproteobacteria bacterium]
MRRIHGIACLLLAACTASSPRGDDDDDDTDPPPGDVIPSAGTWRYNEVVPVSGTCPTQITQVEAGDFVIDQTSATGFRIVPDDGTAPFRCSLAARGAFDCPDRAAFTRDLRPSLDAVVDAHAVADGTFASPAAGAGRQMATVACTGSQCGALGAAFPCTFSVDFRIARKN